MKYQGKFIIHSVQLQNIVENEFGSLYLNYNITLDNGHKSYQCVTL